MSKIDLSGQKFGRLIVIKFSHSANWRQYWLCKCDCGNEKLLPTSYLNDGTKSCGCLRTELLVKRSIKHGMGRTAEYSTWQLIIGRCTNPNNPKFFDYGMRGIAVCERWLHSFENFYADMGDKPSPKHSIDRIDNNGNYEPGNCRWATAKQQARNRRSNKWIEHDGRRMIATDWAKELGLTTGNTLLRYLRTHSIQEAIDRSNKKKLRVIE